MNTQPSDIDVQVAASQSRVLPPRQSNDETGPQQTGANPNQRPQDQTLEIDPAELPVLAQLLIQQKEEMNVAHTRQITAMELRMTAMQARIIRYEALLRERDETISQLSEALNAAQTKAAAAPNHDGGEYEAPVSVDTDGNVVQ